MGFHDLPIWGNVAILILAGIIVWLAGTRLSRYADRISETTKLSSALAGALLLGVATSLPEIATTLTASSLGNAPLAVNNLFGGVAMQLALLAVVDFALARGAITYFSPNPVVLLAGVLLILQLGIALLAISAGDIVLFQLFGAWPVVLGAVYLASLYFMSRFSKLDTWTPLDMPDESDGKATPDPEPNQGDSDSSTSLRQILLLFLGNSALVIVGGWGVSSAADALTKQTGLASGFLGATLVAVTTSLPEISTTTGAIRLGAYTMAFTNIFGTNALEAALLLPSDLLYRDGAIINSVDPSATMLASLGIVMTCLFLWGLLERRNKTFMRMGVDSAWVLATYLVGLMLLYQIAE